MTEVSSEVLVERIDQLRKSLESAHAKLDKIDTDMRIGYVTRLEFEALKASSVSKERIWWLEKVVFGFAGMVLLAFGAAVIKLVFPTT